MNDAAAATAAAATPATEFGPDFAQAAPTLFVLAVTAALGWVWWFQVVPQQRVELSKSKRKGPIKEYLDDLDISDSSERGVERWFFTDWLRARKRRGGQVPDGKAEPFFLSTDNPVVVAGILIGTGVLYSALTGR